MVHISSKQGSNSEFGAILSAKLSQGPPQTLNKAVEDRGGGQIENNYWVDNQ